MRLLVLLLSIPSLFLSVSALGSSVPGEEVQGKRTTWDAEAMPETDPSTSDLGAAPETRERRALPGRAPVRSTDPIDTLEAHLAPAPETYGILVAAARDAVMRGMLTSHEEAALRWYRNGEEHARSALAIDGSGVPARYWKAVALGRRAELQGVRTRARVATEIRDEAEWILSRDSLHAGAHHLLGTWHAEAGGLRGVTRFLARHLLGADDLGEASWPLAIHHLQEAVRLEPDALFFRLDLARAYAERGRREEARFQLRELLAEPPLEPIDPLVLREGRNLLEALE